MVMELGLIKLKSKSGQIAIFFIIGIAILILGSLVTYVMMDAQTEDVDDAIINSVTSINDDRLVKNFITSCLESVGKDGIKQLSQNGGYLDPTSEFSFSVKPYKSEYVVRGPYRIPYWYHYSDNKNTFGMNIPPLKREDGDGSIEVQLDKYIQNNIWNCFEEFAIFSNRFKVSASEISVKTTITSESAVFEMNLPIRLSNFNDASSSTMSEFFSVVPVNLQKLYNLANDIAITQFLIGFLERPIMELIAIHSGLDEILPPIYEVDMFNPGNKPMWFHSDVVKFLKSQILTKTSLIQIPGTRSFIPPPPSEIEIGSGSSLQEIAVQNLLVNSESDYYDIDVNFQYPTSLEPFIQVGSGSAVLRGDTGDNKGDIGGIFAAMLSPIVSKYRFMYALSYPVIIRLCEDTSFKGDGLCFNFAMEGNIRNSETYIPVSAPNQEGFGASTGERETVAFDDPDQYVNKEISFNVRSIEGTKLSGVHIHYACGEKFYIARTSAVPENVYSFTGKFPFCASGGFILVEKPGYMALRKELVSDLREYNNVESDEVVILEDFTMFPEVVVPVFAAKKSIDDWFENEVAVKTGDQIILEINKRKINPLEADYPIIQFLVFGDTSANSNANQIQSILQDSRLSESLSDISAEKAILDSQLEILEESTLSIPEVPDSINKLSLVPGEYDIKLTYLISGDPVVHIPDEERRVCLNGDVGPGEFCFIKIDEYTLPAIDLTTWAVSETEFIWSVSEGIYGAHNITFYAPDLGLPETHSDLGNSQSFNTDAYAHKLIPKVE